MPYLGFLVASPYITYLLYFFYFFWRGGCQLHTSPRYVLLLLLNIFQKAIGLVQKWCCSGKVFFSRKTINLGTKHLIFIPGIRFWGSYIQKITFNITTPLYLKPRKLWSGASPLTRALSKGSRGWWHKGKSYMKFLMAWPLKPDTRWYYKMFCTKD